MKKIIYVTLFVSAILIVNIFVYLISPDFRFFLKKIKYSDNIPSNVIITDDYNNPLGTPVFDCSRYLEECSSFVDSGNNQMNFSSEIQNESIFSSGAEIENSGSTSSGTSVSVNIQTIDIQEFLKKFSFTSFTQKNYDEYYKMFGITDEYVGNYLTYTSSDVEIYYFPEAEYEEIYNFFQTLAYDVDIELNRVNNFGTRNFYINKINRDEFIRLIMEYNGKIFGLKIKNIQYNNVKNVLKGF